MVGKTVRHKEEEIIDAINESRGILTVAAKKLDCSRQTLYNRIKRSEKLSQAYEDSRETFLDIVENKLLENVESGKEASIFFCLRTRGRHRGYGVADSFSVENDLEKAGNIRYFQKLRSKKSKFGKRPEK